MEILAGRLPTMLVDEPFHVTHDFGIASMGGGGHLGQETAAFIVCCCRLRVQHEGHGEQTLDSRSSDTWPVTK